MGLSRETYKQRRDAGLCVQCGRDAGGKALCAACAAKNDAARQRRDEKRKATGKCTRCGKPTEPGYATCPECIQQSTGAASDRYYRNKEARVCRECGKPTENDASRCPECAVRFRNSQQKRLDVKRAAGICLECPKPARPNRKTCVDCAQRIAKRQQEESRQLKLEVLAAYGGPKCAHCGNTDIRVLQIDHVNGGGTKHHKEIGLGRLYKWLKKNNYPAGFQVLCANCNTIKGPNKPEA